MSRVEQLFTPSAGMQLLARAWVWPAAAVLTTAAFLLLRSSVAGVDDVSWLITASERLLDGQRLYVDILEPNPPASVWLYVPAVWLARFFGLAPELILDIQTFLCAAAGLGLSAGILRSGGTAARFRGPGLFVCGFFILALLPHAVFGQRDHYALMMLAPALAVLMQRAEGHLVPLALAALVGVLAGIGVSIKPPYALCLGLAAVFGVAQINPRPRLLRALMLAAVRPEAVACCAMIALYILAIALAAPEFATDMLPILSLIYLPARLPVTELVVQPAFLLCALVLAMVMLATTGKPRAPVCVCASASVGAMLAFLAQGKGFQDHAFPMLALAAAASAFALLDVRVSVARVGQIIALAVLVGVSGGAWRLLRLNWDSTDLRQAIEQVQPAPRMLSISSSLLVGHPIVRQLGGVWVGRAPSLWIHNLGAARRQFDKLDDQTLAQIEVFERAERDRLLEDIRTQRPDVILVGISGADWSKWAAADSAISGQLAAYEDRGASMGVRILRRRR